MVAPKYRGSGPCLACHAMPLNPVGDGLAPNFKPQVGSMLNCWGAEAVRKCVAVLKVNMWCFVSKINLSSGGRYWLECSFHVQTSPFRP